jgi:hypothetical protein
MLPDIVLGAVCLSLLAFHFFSAHQWAEERRFLLNRGMAKTPGEVVMLQRGTAPDSPLTAEVKEKKVPVRPMPLGL